MTHVAPQTHEIEGWLKFGANGLDPYWMLGRWYIEGVDGTAEFSFTVEVDGQPFEFAFYYNRDNAIAAREDDAVDGTLYEWILRGRGPGEAKASFQIKPRFPGMTHVETGEEISTPWQHLVADPDLDVAEGIAVDVSASNVDPRRLPGILRRAVEGLADDLGRRLDRRYFREPIVTEGTAGSNVGTLARYVRPERDLAKKVTRTGGTFHKLATHLSTNASGQGCYRWDNSEAQGYHHRVEVEDADADCLIPGHRFGKQIKHYLLEDPDAVDEDDPTYHPKVEAAFKKKYQGGVVSWAELDAVLDELDEALLNSLAWGDVPIDAGAPVYVADDHFDASARDEDIPIYADPTPELEAETEHLLVTALQDLTDADQEALRALADGGSAHYDELADRADCSISTIYRTLERVGDLLESDAGHVQFTSEQVAQEIRAIVEDTEDRVTSGAERIADLYNVGVRQAASSAFQQWLAKYGADLEMRDGQPVLRIDTLLSTRKADSPPYAPDALREAIEAWNTDGRDPRDLADARLKAEIVGGANPCKVSHVLD